MNLDYISIAIKLHIILQYYSLPMSRMSHSVCCKTRAKFFVLVFSQDLNEEQANRISFGRGL